MRPVVFVALLLAALAASAQTPAWQTAEELSGVDLTGLTGPRKAAALKLMREMGCTCGCDMKVAQCRVEDPPCTYSKGIAALIVKGFKEGRTTAEVQKLVAASPLGHPRDPAKILEDPVSIPTSGAPSTGPANARVVLVEFSDFECPYCAIAAKEIRAIAGAYAKEIRLVYKQFPLPMHPHAVLAALASLAAQEQGKFWELHDKMFANYRQLSKDNILKWAQELNIDMDKFQAAMDSPKNKAIVQQDLKDGESAGVSGTPTLYIDGKHFNGPIQMAALKPVLDQELKSAPSAKP